MTLAHVAAGSGHAAVLHWLISKGADLDIAWNGGTPLRLARNMHMIACTEIIEGEMCHGTGHSLESAPSGIDHLSPHESDHETLADSSIGKTEERMHVLPNGDFSDDVNDD